MRNSSNCQGLDALFNHLFRKYFRTFCGFARNLLKGRSEPEDVVMTCFAKLWERENLIENEIALKTYMYVTIRNLCYDLLRKKGLKRISSDSVQTEVIDEDANFIQAIIETEVLRQILTASEELPPQIKKVFHLYFVEGLTEHDISKKLKTSYHTVRNQRQRSVIILKEKISLQKKTA